MVTRNDLLKTVALTVGMMAAAAPARAETLGFVLTGWHNAGHHTEDGKLECPNGFSPGHRDNFRAQFKTPEGQAAALSDRPNIQMTLRGPNGESDKYSPELVVDPLPFHEGQGTISTGFNLDGTMDGRATDKTCAHGKFTSPDGERGIDNQLYRVQGCVAGLRPGGVSDGLINSEVVTKQINRLLVEITGVDDRVNDDRVEVMIAHGLDKLARDGNGSFVPGLSQRVNEKAAQYIFRTTGRIENGVLITDAFKELEIGQTGVLEQGLRKFKDARLRLKLSGDTATGVLAGYHDLQDFYRFWAKTTGQHSIVAQASPPSIYASMVRNADGYKDPATGKCTAISAAYDMNFVRAFIVRKQATTEVSENTPRTAVK